jgi:hypothetical protein
MKLNATKLKARRRDLGYTTRGIALTVNLPLTAITRAEVAGDVGSLTTTTLERYLNALGLDLIEVLEPRTNTEQAEDPAALDRSIIGLLHELNRGTSALEIAKVLQVSIDDVRTSLDRIEGQLTRIGLRLHLASSGYTIAPAATRDLGKPTLPEQLRRLASINSADIHLVHRLMNGPLQERTLTQNPTGVTSLGKLIATGIATSSSGEVTLAESTLETLGTG